MPLPTRSQSSSFIAIPNFEGYAIAQTSEIRSVNPTPPPQYQTSDPLLWLLGGIVSSGAFIGFWSRFGNNFLISQQTNSQLQSQIKKTESDLALSEEKARLAQTKELFDLVLGSLKEERKTTKEILDIFIAKFLNSTTEAAENAVTQQALLQSLVERLAGFEKTLDRIDNDMRDIFDALKIEKRTNV